MTWNILRHAEQIYWTGPICICDIVYVSKLVCILFSYLGNLCAPKGASFWLRVSGGDHIPLGITYCLFDVDALFVVYLQHRRFSHMLPFWRVLLVFQSRLFIALFLRSAIAKKYMQIARWSFIWEHIYHYGLHTNLWFLVKLIAVIWYDLPESDRCPSLVGCDLIAVCRP